MPLPALFPGAHPSQPPDPVRLNTRGEAVGGGSFGQVLRPIEGVVIAFASDTMTDQPLWIRLDDLGTI